MGVIKLKQFSMVIFIAYIFVLLGCAPKTYKLHPQFNTNCQLIKSYCLVKPDVEICEISAGGIKEKRDDWCAQGLENVVAALQKTLDLKNVNYKPITIDDDLKKEIEDIQALYRAVSMSIRMHAIGPGPYVFPDKSASFDYSIGPINAISDRYDCDALIIVYGTDEISTGGRQALMALGAIAGAFTGVVVMPAGGLTTINFALIDENGEILYYTSKAGGGFDLRKPESALSLVNQVITDYPECKK